MAKLSISNGESGSSVRTKLNTVDLNATDDMTGAEIKALYEVEANAYDDTKDTKLTGIESGATADQSDAEIETAYNNQVAIVSQAAAEAGTSTTAERWTPQRVKQAIDALGGGGGGTSDIIIAVSDEDSDLTTGTAKVTFRMPQEMTLTGVKASVTTAPTGSTIIVDINEGGTTILSTKLSIDATEKTSATAATPAVISDSSLAADAEITIDIDQVGSTVAGTGLKVTLLG